MSTHTKRASGHSGAFPETSKPGNGFRDSTAIQTFDRDPIFSQYGTEDLLRARECLGWDLAECRTEPDSTTKDGGLAFIELQLASIEHELQRRERLRHRPGAPAWPAEPTEAMRAFWRDLKDRVTVLHLYERHFPMQPLKRHGASWRQRCPFCGGTNESEFSVYQAGRRWHCFRCNQSGDVFTFAGLLYRTTRFGEIAERLADEFGIEKPATYESSVRPESRYIGVGTLGTRDAKPISFEIRGGKAVAS